MRLFIFDSISLQLSSHVSLLLIVVPSILIFSTISTFVSFRRSLVVNWWLFVKFIIMDLVLFSLIFIFWFSVHLSISFRKCCNFRFLLSIIWPWIGMSEAICCLKLCEPMPMFMRLIISSIEKWFVNQKCFVWFVIRDYKSKVCPVFCNKGFINQKLLYDL